MASAICCSTSCAPSSIAAAAPSLSVSSRAASTRSSACSVSRAVDASGALAGLRVASCDRRRRCAVQRSAVWRPVVAAAEAGDGGVPEARAPESPIATVAPPTSPKKKSKVPAKPLKSQRVLLRFLWLEKNIGISLDQVVPGHGVIPLSPYFFWPRKDAWEELKAKLESKKWISNKRTIVLLNQATDLINLWQASASNNQF